MWEERRAGRALRSPGVGLDNPRTWIDRRSIVTLPAMAGTPRAEVVGIPGYGRPPIL